MLFREFIRENTWKFKIKKKKKKRKDKQTNKQKQNKNNNNNNNNKKQQQQKKKQTNKNKTTTTTTVGAFKQIKNNDVNWKQIWNALSKSVATETTLLSHENKSGMFYCY